MFNPGIIIVSAGFDAADGHPPNIGGYKVSPACFAAMTSSLVQLSEGKVSITTSEKTYVLIFIFYLKVVLALEGGYVGPAVAESATECLKVLLGDQHSKVSSAELGRFSKSICKYLKANISIFRHFYSFPLWKK